MRVLARRDIRHIRQVSPRVRVAQGNIQGQITVIRYFPSVLWHGWLGDWKDIRSVKFGCWFCCGDDLTEALHVLGLQLCTEKE